MFYLIGKGGLPLGYVKSEAVAQEFVKQGRAIHYGKSNPCKLQLWPSHGPRHGEFVESAEFNGQLVDIYKHDEHQTLLLVGEEGAIGQIMIL